MEANEKRLMVETAGMLGGLVQQMHEDAVMPLQSGFIGRNTGKTAADACECAITTVQSCYRSSSQRSLSTPYRLQSDPVIVAAGADIFTGLLVTLFGLGLPTVEIYNANNNVDRQRIQDLVLIGFRIRPNISAVPNGAVDSHDTRGMETVLRRWLGMFAKVEIFHSADTRDPWVFDTLWSYFDRENSGQEIFLPIPPVRWRGRDAKVQLSVRPADFSAPAAGGGGYPQGVNGVSQAVVAWSEVEVETLWILDPDICGQYWPGELCAPELVSVSGVKGGFAALKQLFSGKK